MALMYGVALATVARRRHKGFDGQHWGFDCEQGFAPLGCEEGCERAAAQAADLYNSGVQVDWSFWPFKETVQTSP